MANLSSTLGDVNDVTQVVAKPAVSEGLGTALNALSRGLTGFANLWDDQARAKKAAASEARAAAKDQRETNDYNATDAAFRAANSISQNLDPNRIINKTMGVSGDQADFGIDTVEPQPLGEGVTSSIATLAKQIGSYTVGVKQGTVSETTRRAAIDMAFNQILTQHPEYSAAVIGEGFKKAGVDSDLFRTLKDNQSDYDAARLARQKQNNDFIELGRQITTPDVAAKAGMTDDDFLLAGQQYSARMKLAEATKLDVDTTNARNQGTRDNIDFTKKEAADQIYGASVESVTAAISPTLSALSRIINSAPEAGSDATAETRLAGLVPKVRTYTSAVIENAVKNAEIAHPGSGAALRTELQAYVDNQFFKPLTERGGAMMAASQAIGNSFKLRMDQSFPLINEMRSLGLKTEDVPNLVQSLNPEVQEQIRRELGSFTPKGLATSVGKQHLLHAVDLLTGNATLNDLKGKNWKEPAVAAMARFVTGNSIGVAQGRNDPDSWLNANRTVVLASQSVTRNSGAPVIDKALQTIANTANINALDRLQNDPAHGEEARITAHASRASVASMTSEANAAMRAEAAKNPYQILGWDAANGEWRLAFNDKKWAADGGNQAQAGAGFKVGMTTSTRPEPSAALTALVRSTNRGIRYLTSTTKWDPDSPRGTPKELKNFYGRDIPTSEMQKEKAVKGKTGDFVSMIDAVEKDLVSTPDLVGAGTNSDIIGPEGTAKNPRSSAAGVGQFIDSTYVSVLKKHAPELVQNKSNAEILQMRGNKALETRMVGWYRSDNAAHLAAKGLPSGRTATAIAHFAGPQGAEALFTADPSTLVERALGAAAVKANPQLRGKTVGETIEWAKRFYAP